MPLNFVDRHNGPREAEQKEMLKALGCSSLDELISQTVPQDIMLKEPLKLDKAVSEYEYTAALKKTAALNKNFRSLIGMGFYGTASPGTPPTPRTRPKSPRDASRPSSTSRR